MSNHLLKLIALQGAVKEAYLKSYLAGARGVR